MQIQEKQVVIRKLIANDGMIITKKNDSDFFAKLVYLGCEDDINNYIEIPENINQNEEVQNE